MLDLGGWRFTSAGGRLSLPRNGSFLPAASHDILEFMRCNRKPLKRKGILGAPNPSPAAYRYAQYADCTSTADLRPQNQADDTREGRANGGVPGQGIAAAPECGPSEGCPVAIIGRC